MKQAWVVLLLLLPAVYAAGTIETADTIIDFKGKTAQIQTELAFTLQTNVKNLTFILTKEPNDVEITIDNETVDCLLQAEFARCGTWENGTHFASISYETDYPIADVGENTIIRYTDKLPYPAKVQQVTLKLPVGYIIPRERGKDESFYVSPAAAETYSDGQRIILHWEQEGQELPLSVIARKFVGPPTGWIAATGASLALALGVILWALQREKKKPPKKQKKKELLPKFIEDEQKVVDIIKKAPNNEAWQKEVLKETGFSKAKLSRIIRNLEQRKVITKTIYGNTNKISLKK